MPAPKDGISEFVGMLRIAIEQALDGRLPHDTAELVADGAAHSFVGAFGGSTLYVPRHVAGELERRNREIYTTWLDSIPSERNATLRRLVAEHGLSENQVYRIIREQQERRVRSKEATTAEVRAWKISSSPASA